MRPSGRGRRYVNSRNGVSMFDGPFVETKELLAGYIIVSADSLDEAGRWAARYIEAVGAERSRRSRAGMNRMTTTEPTNYRLE